MHGKDESVERARSNCGQESMLPAKRDVPRSATDSGRNAWPENSRRSIERRRRRRQQGVALANRHSVWDDQRWICGSGLRCYIAAVADLSVAAVLF